MPSPRPSEALFRRSRSGQDRCQLRNRGILSRARERASGAVQGTPFPLLQTARLVGRCGRGAPAARRGAASISNRAPPGKSSAADRASPRDRASRRPHHAASVRAEAASFGRNRSRQRVVELAHVNRFSTAGELSASIAHEINQPLGAILTNTETARLMLQSPSPDLGEIKEILDIWRDNRRASEVVRRLRSFVSKAPFQRQEFDLNDLVVDPSNSCRRKPGHQRSRCESCRRGCRCESKVIRSSCNRSYPI